MHADIGLIHRNRSETIVSWQGIEFNTYVDNNIIYVNRTETIVSRQGTEFCTHVEISVPAHRRGSSPTAELLAK